MSGIPKSEFKFNFSNRREMVDVCILLGFLGVCVMATLTGFVTWARWIWLALS